MKKKFLVLFTICLFAIIAFAANSYAANNMEVYCEVIVNHRDLIQNQKKVVDNLESVKKTLAAKSTGNNFLATPGVSTDLETVIVNAVKSRSGLVYIDSFGLNTSTFDVNAITYVLNDHPELFYCAGIITYWDSSTGDILAIEPQYTYDEAVTNEILESLAEYRANVFYSLDSDMNDVEKLMVAHDFVIKTCDYDYERLNSDTLIAEDFTLVGVLNGTAVCQGYTMMLKYLLDEMDIESTYVYSTAMNHIWNAVEIDGKYYHVDSTWTDPGEYYFAEVYRKYFLKGNDYFENEADHYSWECGVSNFGTAYDDYFWNNNAYFFAYVEDYWYYYKDKETLVKVDLRNNATQTEITVSDMQYYITNPYIASDGVSLYFVGTDCIWRLYLDDLTVMSYFATALEEDQYMMKMTNLTPNVILYSYENADTYWVDYFEVYPLKGVELSKESTELDVGETETVTWSFLPEDTTDVFFMEITSSDESVATVNENGLITAVSAGSATITITVNGKVTDTMTVTVKEVSTGGETGGESPSSILGDVDGNGVVTVRDARLVVQDVVDAHELTAEERERADMDGDGRITVRDARKVLELAMS